MAMANEEWLTFEDAIELVRAHLGASASVGRSEAVTNAARASGEVRFQNPADPVLLMADDGLVGMDMRPGALKKGGINADGKLVIHDLRPHGMFQISKDDLLDWLGRQYPHKASAQPISGRKRGRPPAYNWQEIRKVTFELMDENGDFSADDPEWNAQARLEEALNKKFGVEKSALRQRLPKFLTDWRKLKAGN